MSNAILVNGDSHKDLFDVQFLPIFGLIQIPNFPFHTSDAKEKGVS